MFGWHYPTAPFTLTHTHPLLLERGRGGEAQEVEKETKYRVGKRFKIYI